jgi:predicted metal-dependent HD superfamily phosphohydrolase
MQCTVESPPFASLHTLAGSRTGNLADGSIVLTIESNSYPPSSYTGYAIDAVRVTGGTLVNIKNVIPNGAFHYDIEIDDAMAVVLVDVDLSCGANEATKHYRISANTLNPNGLMVEEIAAVDGGTPGDAGTD